MNILAHLSWPIQFSELTTSETILCWAILTLLTSAGTYIVINIMRRRAEDV